MSKIDVRDGTVGPVDEIIFGDNHSDYFTTELSKVNAALEPDYIEFYDSDGDYARKLKISDIDNMIKALQKAQELWG